VVAESADEIQRLFRNSFQIWQSENAELEQIVLRFSGQAAQLVRERNWHASQQIQELADSNLELSNPPFWVAVPPPEGVTAATISCVMFRDTFRSFMAEPTPIVYSSLNTKMRFIVLRKGIFLKPLGVTFQIIWGDFFRDKWGRNRSFHVRSGLALFRSLGSAGDLDQAPTGSSLRRSPDGLAIFGWGAFFSSSPFVSIERRAHLKLDRLEAAMLDMSVAEVARKLSVPTIASHIFWTPGADSVAISALRLSPFFGASAEFWLNLRSLYDLAAAQQKAGKLSAADT
jgi:plasmid maintenance system antidote protein VapI